MDHALRILLIDESPDEADIVRAGLCQELSAVQVDHVRTREQFEHALQTYYDVAITTYRQSWGDCVSVCAALKARDSDMSILLLLAPSEEGVVVDAVRTGIDAYIIRIGNYLNRLSASVGLAFERRVQRRAAREVASELHQLFDRVPLGLYRITPDGAILEANAALVQISGCPDKQTLLSRNASEFFISQGNFRKWNSRVESQDAVHDYEGPARRYDGSIMWVRNNVRVARNADGSVLYYEGSLELVSERRQIEQALRESQSFLEQAQEVGEIGSWVSGLGDDKSLRWSRQAYRIFGVDDGAPIDINTFFSLVHQDDREPIRLAVENAIMLHAPYSINHRIVLADGSQRWLFERAEVIYDANDKPLRMIGVVQDITERMRREEDILHEKALTEQTLNSMPGIFYLIDQSHRFVRWNQNFEAVSGYSSEEIAQLHPNALAPPEQHDFGGCALTEIFRRKAAEADATLLTKQGKRIPYHFTNRCIELGGQPCIIGTGVDVSERVRTEQEIRLLQTITLAMSEQTSDLESALEIVLRKICDATGWTVGEAWLPNGDNTRLTFGGASYVADAELKHFVSHNYEISFARGEALPGRAWESKQPVWMSEITSSYVTPRAPLIRAAGLKASMAVPVLAGEEVVAILLFFVRQARPQDSRLMQIVSGAAAQLGLVIQRKAAETRIHYLAHFDGLTGLPNRTLLTDRLNQTLIEAARHQRLVGVMQLDLDRFKNINDSLTHEVGDQLIKAVADRLLSALRDGDTVARLSGDEFAIVLSDMGNTDDAGRVARKILSLFTWPFEVRGSEIYATASLGITLYPADGIDASGLMRNADVAMYRAKEAGGNVYQFYSADMTSRAVEKLALENDLRHAIERDEFLLHYQPLVDAHRGEIIAVEALIRWRHPKRGMIAPAHFIPLAEESGMIVAIGEWVLRNACRQCRQWRDEGFPRLRVAVNLSARQLQHESLESVVIGILRETDLDPRALELELTESMIMQSATENLSVMRRLADIGVTFSIDDFGTGYSNLAYLKRFPVDVLKIDRGFVQDIPHDADDAAIAQAIITMAHSLNMQVVAEGVETEQQALFLRAHGCDVLQGFYFSKPLPADEARQLLRRDSPPSSRQFA